MFHDLNAQFQTQILPAYQKFRDMRLDGQMGNYALALAATSCASVLYHFREYIPKEHRPTRKEVSEECPEYKLIADVTNAMKHSVLSRPPLDGPALVRSSNDIYELAVIINFDGDGVCEPYSHCEPVVCVKCTDGIDRYLDDALVEVINFWGSKLKELGIAEYDKIIPLPFPGTIFIPQDSARGITEKRLKGLGGSSNAKLMEFDHQSGFARPIDLTGAQVEFTMYRPRFNLIVEIKIPTIPETYHHVIGLSDQESQEYIALKDEKEVATFQTKIANEQKDQIEEGLAEFIGSLKKVK